MIETRKSTWARLLLVVLFLLPLAFLFFLSGSGPGAGLWLWFWILVFLFCCLMVVMMFGLGEGGQMSELEARMLKDDEQPPLITDVMNVGMATEEKGVKIFRGTLRESAASVYQKLKDTFSDQTVPLVQEDEHFGAAIVLMPRSIEERTLERPVRPWIHWLLFALTVLTTTWAGAAHQGIDLLREPARFAVGLPYSLGLLSILGLHELGHYFMARRHQMRVTPPYFIPVPFALGTFGAFIQMRSPVENRRTLFDVAVAGPLAGLLVAIPALLVGLESSTVIGERDGDALTVTGGTSVASSLLFALLAKLSLGDALEYGHVLRLSPLAFAGWLGLLVTALNLLPIGQLDGGHIAHALFGRRKGEMVSSVAMWSLLLLAIFVWPGLLMWALIIFLIAGRTVPPLNDVTGLTPRRRWIGYATLAILVLILTPLPHAFWRAAGIHCPYS